MFETFRARAEAVSAEVRRVATRAEALEVVLGVLRDAGVGEGAGEGAVWAEGPFLAGLDEGSLARRVPGLTFEVTREAAAAARVGVTEMDFAVANTGTLAQAADDPAQRLASTLPAIHVALVPADRMVADLGELFARLGPARSRYLALVTGPSRTADIERVLTIGVHGPARLVIVVVDDLQGRIP
ncbi:MAG TPA: lactate utilization protein [Anaeromyxobacteraceae bacterium]|jgi:L-lactate dehydrogenase complex protein LldG|nr:lactate utilization protein [Anaeromyxobacteraceae bacterium]